MANIKQQKKRIITDRKKTLRNKSFKSQVKTVYKKAITAVVNAEGSSKTTILQKIKLAVKLLDRAAARKIKHKNYASRKKSQLHKLVQQKLPDWQQPTPSVAPKAVKK